MTSPASTRPSRTAGMISWNGSTTISPPPPSRTSAAHSRNSRYAVDRSDGTATVRPVRSTSASRVSTSGPHPRPSAPPQGSSTYSSRTYGSTAYDTFSTSNSPRSAIPLVMSMSAKVTSSEGAPGTRPWASASKTNVSFGQGEYAICSGSVVMVFPTLQYGRKLPEPLGQGRERVADPPGGPVARTDRVGDGADLQHGHPVCPGRLGDPEALHGLGEGGGMAFSQGGRAGGRTSHRGDGEHGSGPAAGRGHGGPYECFGRTVGDDPEPQAGHRHEPLGGLGPEVGRGDLVGDDERPDRRVRQEPAGDAGGDDEPVGSTLHGGHGERGGGAGGGESGPDPHGDDVDGRRRALERAGAPPPPPPATAWPPAAVPSNARATASRSTGTAVATRMRISYGSDGSVVGVLQLEVPHALVVLALARGRLVLLDDADVQRLLRGLTLLLGEEVDAVEGVVRLLVDVGHLLAVDPQGPAGVGDLLVDADAQGLALLDLDRLDVVLLQGALGDLGLAEVVAVVVADGIGAHRGRTDRDGDARRRLVAGRQDEQSGGNEAGGGDCTAASHIGLQRGHDGRLSGPSYGPLMRDTACRAPAAG